MRFVASGLLAGLVVVAACGTADGFGRGGFAHVGGFAGPRGAAFGGAHGGFAAGPLGAAAGGARGGTYVGPRGTTVQAGRAGGIGVGPFGGVHAGGAGGVRVTTPGGRTFSDVNAGRAGVGPLGGVYAGRAGGAYAGGPFGAVGGAYRGGVAVGPAGGWYGGGRVGHYTTYVSPNTLRASAAVVRGGYHYAAFTPNWYRVNAAAWVAPRWVAPVWTVPTWPAVASFVGVAAAPAVYDYGSTVVINDDTVYVNGAPAASAADYAAQAATLADTGRAANAADAQDWQPLGVFGMIHGDEKVAQRIFQLGINKAGVVRGNYYDAVADNTLPVYGSLDTKSQRVAWSIGDKKDIVFEAGLSSLTQPEATVLVHYGKERTDQAALVRLEQPVDKK